VPAQPGDGPAAGPRHWHHAGGDQLLSVPGACAPRKAAAGAGRATERGAYAHARCCACQSRAAEEGEDDESEGANYQLEMMRCLREVNVDNNTVGWRVAAAAVLFAPVCGVADRFAAAFAAPGTSPRTWGRTRRWS
jgi:hypothetical protein